MAWAYLAASSESITFVDCFIRKSIFQKCLVYCGIAFTSQTSRPMLRVPATNIWRRHSTGAAVGAAATAGIVGALTAAAVPKMVLPRCGLWPVLFACAQ
jgi:hypothetical protein